MADPFVDVAVDVFTGIAGSTAINAGDLVYFDGTDWELADASDNTKFAEAMCVSAVVSGETAAFTSTGILVDADAPYTQGDQYYLSETAGEITRTRPTTIASLRQVCAYGLSTSELKVQIHMPREHHEVYNLFSAVAAEAVTQLDNAGTGIYFGVTTNADAETITATFSVPQNCVGLEFAQLFSAVEVRSAATDLTILVRGAADGEQWDAGSADATLTTLVVSGAAADEIQGSDVTTAFDGAGIIEPDNVVAFHGTHDGSQTDVTLYFALEVVYLVV